MRRVQRTRLTFSAIAIAAFSVASGLSTGLLDPGSLGLRPGVAEFPGLITFNAGDSTQTRVLPDGTVLALTPHSSIYYELAVLAPPRPGEPATEVIQLMRLNGEASFVLAEDGQPAVMRLSEFIDVKADAPTLFSARAVAGRNQTEVRVGHGQLVLAARAAGSDTTGQHTITLSAGEVARVSGTEIVRVTDQSTSESTRESTSAPAVPEPK